MTVLLIIAAIIGVIAIFAFAIGLLLLPFSKFRKAGKEVTRGSLFWMIASALVWGLFHDHLTDTKSTDLPKDAKATVEETHRLEAERKKELAGFPDMATKNAAKALGLKSYAAYQLRNDKAAIQRYCDWSDKAYPLARQRDSEYDANPNEDARAKIYQKYEALQQQLLTATVAPLGIEEWEFTQLSINAHWDFYCRAQKRNWVVITKEMARAASRSDAKEAVKSLNGFYLENLNNGTSHFFDNNRFSSVRCTWENYNGMRFVGCKLQSFSYVSDWDIFVVARLADGRLAVSPINGKTSQHVTSSGKSKHLNRIAQARTYLDGYGEPRTYLAEYAGLIDIQAVRQLFE